MLPVGKSTPYPIKNSDNQIIGKVYVLLKNIKKKVYQPSGEDRKRRVHTDNSITSGEKTNEEDENDISRLIFFT